MFQVFTTLVLVTREICLETVSDNLTSDLWLCDFKTRSKNPTILLKV
jgi:hypothetical protein